MFELTRKLHSRIQHWLRPNRPSRSLRRQATLAHRHETLEPRHLLHGASPLSSEDRFLTLSFAEDGTDIAGHESALFSKFDQLFERDQWQSTVLQAFQSWASHTSTDIGWVTEDGRYPFGTPGPATDDDRFGDIRIGARPLAADVMAISISQEAVLSGTWAADVIFNSDAEFDSLDSLFSVTLHEAGHVYGLEHRDEIDSAMRVHGVSSVTSPSAADIFELQQLHGRRVPDQWEGASGNDEFTSAKKLEPLEAGNNRDGSAPAIALAELTAPGDVDYYRIEGLGDYRGSLTFRLQTAGISLLAPELTIFNSQREVISQRKVSTPPQSSLAYTIPQADPDETYLVRVRSLSDDDFSVGAYSLLISFDDAVRVPPEQIEEVVFTRLKRPDRDLLEAMMSLEGEGLNDDQHTDDEADNAITLEASLEFEETRRFSVVGSITEPSDVDFYKLDTPETDLESLVMNVSVRSQRLGGLIPSVSIFDEDLRPIESRTLVNGGGQFLTEVSSIIPDKEYFVRISGQDGALFDTGDYQMMVAFPDRLTELAEFMVGTVSQSNLHDVRHLHVAVPQLIHFALDVAEQGGATTQGVLARVLNEEGDLVYQIGSRPGETRTAGSLLLAPGSYLVQVAWIQLPNSDEQPVGLDYRLSGIVVSDPFAVDPEVPSESEFDCPDSVDALYCYPGGILSDDPFIWLDFLDSLLEIPDLEGQALQSALLGDWWSWYWQSAGTNAPPLTVDDSYSIQSPAALVVDEAHGVLANDMDPDSRAITSLLVEGPTHGQLVLASNGSFVYTPDVGFAGDDTFSYQAFDFQSNSRITSSRITVLPNEPIDGDFNHDGSVDELDIDLLATAIRTDKDLAFDLNDSGATDEQDLQFMITSVVGTSFGDANLDGLFDSSDLVLVFQKGHYDGGLGTASWSAGDWNGDGRFDSGDLVLAFETGTYIAAAVQSDALSRSTNKQRVHVG